jgi:hypothetical protein
MTSNIFSIYPKNPEPFVCLAGNAPRLADAIELGFPMEADNAVVVWNDLSIPLNYKYDLSVILDDVLDILNHCLEDKKIKTWFASNTFTAQWTVDTHDEIVEVQSDWRAVISKNTNQLNQVPSISVPKMYFLKQWSGLLETALAGVQRTILVIEDTQSLRDAESIIQKISKLK